MPTELVDTILVVEDEALVRINSADILGDAGYDILEAADADEALRVLTQHQSVQLLFSDIDMPGTMNGLDLARVVHQRWPHIKLLLTSGHHCISNNLMPADGKFVAKPWNQDVLIARVRDLLHPADC